VAAGAVFYRQFSDFLISALTLGFISAQSGAIWFDKCGEKKRPQVHAYLLV
jgi:hypothetical protein